MNWYWLSFCDASRPTGQQFLGACIVGPAGDMAEAVKLAHLRGCNPGGEVQGFPVLSHMEPKIPTSYRDRLLSRVEAVGFDSVLAGEQ